LKKEKWKGKIERVQIFGVTILFYEAVFVKRAYLWELKGTQLPNSLKMILERDYKLIHRLKLLKTIIIDFNYFENHIFNVLLNFLL